MRVRPLCGQVLIQVLGPIPVSSVIDTPDRHVSAEEQQQLNHRPTPPPPLTGTVLEVGPWKRLKNGLAMLPPVQLNDKVLIRDGSGQRLNWGVNEELRLVKCEDLLAVLS